jgi:hypothetical protein
MTKRLSKLNKMIFCRKKEKKIFQKNAFLSKGFDFSLQRKLISLF